MALAAVPLFLCGCGVPGEVVQSPPPGARQLEIGIPRGGFLDCGPETLAALLVHFGKPADVEDISKAICVREKGGTNPLAMAVYAGRSGLKSRAAPGATLDTLRAALEMGIPPLVMVKPNPLILHFFLVVGVRDRLVWCAHYDGGAVKFTEEEFLEIWSPTQRYTLFIAPDVSKIPYSEDDYLRTLDEPPFPAEALDGRTHFLIGEDYRSRGHLKLAKIEYQRAIDWDPAQVGAALALGNLYYDEKNYEAAAEAFRRGSYAGGACANNLAWILSEHFGRHADALEFARGAEAQSVRLADAWFQSLDTQGTVLLRLGRPAEAEAAWARGAEAAEEGQGSLSNWEGYRAGCEAGAARAALAQGKAAEARAWLEKARRDGLDAAAADALEREIGN